MLARAQGLLVRTYTHVNQDLLELAPLLKVVARAGVGLDRIDLAACEARSIPVVYTPDANTQAVAEYVFALLFDALRPRARVMEPLSDQEWRANRVRLVAAKQFSDITFGIWGLGRIGQRVARIASALGSRVIACDLLEIPEASRHGATMVTHETLLAESNVLSIHVDPRPENHGLIGASVLRQLRDDVVIVNTSRGVIVNSQDLATFLVSNPNAKALLDVHHPEPITQAYPLMGLANVVISPHIAAATVTAHENMSWVVRDLWKVLCGEEPMYRAVPAGK